MKVFIVRLAEQAGVSFVIGFGAVALAGNGALSTNVIGGALAAGLRAVYGVIVKEVGSDPQAPSVK